MNYFFVLISSIGVDTHTCKKTLQFTFQWFPSEDLKAVERHIFLRGIDGNIIALFFSNNDLSVTLSCLQYGKSINYSIWILPTMIMIYSYLLPKSFHIIGTLAEGF
jgi:hypothetical protein